MNIVLSVLTHSDVQNARDVIVQGFLGNSTGTANCAIKTTEVYSICMGAVVAVGEDIKKRTYTVTVELDSQHWIRYSNLKQCCIEVGDNIDIETHIGTASGNLVRLEYCTAKESQFPVREGGRELYKQDPTPIIFNSSFEDA